jgi:hypothetical protein
MSLGVIELFALASVCVAAVFFMLVFLRALLREAIRPRVRLSERRERISATPVSREHDSRRLDRAA